MEEKPKEETVEVKAEEVPVKKPKGRPRKEPTPAQIAQREKNLQKGRDIKQKKFELQNKLLEAAERFLSEEQSKESKQKEQVPEKKEPEKKEESVPAPLPEPKAEPEKPKEAPVMRQNIQTVSQVYGNFQTYNYPRLRKNYALSDLIK